MISEVIFETIENFIFLFSNIASRLMGSQYETDSLCAMAHRKNWTKLENLFNFLIFYEEDHCKRAYNDLRDREIN